MTQHIRGNWLLISLAVVYAAYVCVGMMTPRPYISSVVGIMATLAGAFMFSRYAGKAWDILWNRERGMYGAHNAVLGAAEFSLGLVVSGLYRLAWNYFDQPLAWSGTWVSSLGLFMIAKGAYRMAISPSDDIAQTKFPDGFWSVVIWLFGLMVAFVAGTHFGAGG